MHSQLSAWKPKQQVKNPAAFHAGMSAHSNMTEPVTQPAAYCPALPQQACPALLRLQLCNDPSNGETHGHSVCMQNAGRIRLN